MRDSCLSTTLKIVSIKVSFLAKNRKLSQEVGQVSNASNAWESKPDHSTRGLNSRSRSLSSFQNRILNCPFGSQKSVINRNRLRAPVHYFHFSAPQVTVFASALPSSSTTLFPAPTFSLPPFPSPTVAPCILRATSSVKYSP